MRIFKAVCLALALACAGIPTATASASPAGIAVATTVCGEGYYRNSAGRCIPRPARTPDNRPPAGATARCRDGTYSYSQSRRGTCSHHGGVSRWL